MLRGETLSIARAPGALAGYASRNTVGLGLHSPI